MLTKSVLYTLPFDTGSVIFLEGLLGHTLIQVLYITETGINWNLLPIAIVPAGINACPCSWVHPHQQGLGSTQKPLGSVPDLHPVDFSLGRPVHAVTL